jgi:ectoine hydroxylase-related dioxygenase (phytanoyl-CoA dioxygenase family)
VIAAQVLSERTGRLAAQLMGYTGARMLQDNCLWKPPGARSLGMHQDGSFADYLVPAEMITCWVALDDTHAEGGTIEYARGSHRWPKVAPDRGSFHAPDDWLAPVRSAAPDGEEPELVPVVVKAGGCSFHHSLTFHGSGPNEATTHRRAVVSHLVAAHTRFHPTNVDQTYSRYRRRGDLSMDESFFPVLWDESGARTAWLQELPELT